MRIGIVAATNFEIQPAIDFLLLKGGSMPHHDFEILITGVGSLASAYHLTNFIKNKQPQYLVQAGIAGSFDHSISLAESVLIREEIMGDTGVEENNFFSDIFDMGFMKPSMPPFTNSRLLNPHIDEWQQSGLRLVTGITVNEITTRQERINLLRKKYQCDIESMEGAAFHYVCLQEKIPFIQLRSLSNYVGERDKSKWKLKDSIQNLNSELIWIIQKID